ncbi:MAG: hypothetical protein MUO63_18965 [Desulfobulbaceae bacterium]|nr:hypothetical protein [Desulfobulbaceae bacterium]
MYKKTSIFIFILFFVSLSFIKVPQVSADTDNRPDLIITNFWIWPENPTSRNWFDIRVRVRNAGNNVTKNNTTLNLYIGGSPTPYSFTIGFIQPGKDMTKEKRILLDKAGNYIARAVVDPGNLIIEKREDNNSKELRFKVKQASNQDYLPELEASVYKQEPNEPCTDDTINFSGRITNKGIVKSPASVAAIQIGGATPVLISVPSLEPNQYKSLTLTKNLPTPGKYKVTVVADYYNRITEYNEKNNTDSLNFEVFGDCCVDYDVSNFWIWPNNPKAGETFDIRMRVYNRGKKTATKSTTVSLFIGGSAVPVTFILNPLAPKKEWTKYHTVSFSRAGRYTTRIFVDTERKISECRKDNNEKSMSFNVK